MICPTCQTNYALLKNQWHYEQNRYYRVNCDVFTYESLHQLLQHAVENGLTRIYVDTYTADQPKCDDCFLLHIRERQKRSIVIKQPEYEPIEYHEFFSG